MDVSKHCRIYRLWARCTVHLSINFCTSKKGSEFLLQIHAPSFKCMLSELFIQLGKARFRSPSASYELVSVSCFSGCHPLVQVLFPGEQFCVENGTDCMEIIEGLLTSPVQCQGPMYNISLPLWLLPVNKLIMVFIWLL